MKASLLLSFFHRVGFSYAVVFLSIKKERPRATLVDFQVRGWMRVS